MLRFPFKHLGHLYFPCFLPLAKMPRIMLQRQSKSRWFCLAPDIRVKQFSVSCEVSCRLCVCVRSVGECDDLHQLVWECYTEMAFPGWSHLVIVYHTFICYCILFADVLFRIFVSLLTRAIGL